MNEPSPWLGLTVEAVGAIGSASAAIVAVVLANRERSERRAAQAEAASLRAQARRAQASRVIVHVRPQRPPTGLGLDARPRADGGVASWRVQVENTSDAPIRHVGIRVSPEDEPTVVDALNVADVVAPGTAAKPVFGPRRNEVVDAAPAYRLTFVDANDVRWALDESARLTEVDGAP